MENFVTWTSVSYVRTTNDVLYACALRPVCAPVCDSRRAQPLGPSLTPSSRPRCAAMPEAAAAGGGKAAARARAAAQEAALSVSVQKFTRGGQARSPRLGVARARLTARTGARWQPQASRTRS